MRILFVLLCLLPFFVGNAQDIRSVEISMIVRYDRHGNYVSNFAGRAYNDTTKLYGMSYGVSFQYRHELIKDLSAYIGLGYYRLGIDRIRGNLPFGAPGVRTGRNIDYDDGSTSLLYSTTKYHYNNLALTAGISKSLALQKQLKIEVSAEGLGYYSFSQRYDLNEGYRIYKPSNPKKLEFGANLLLSVVKEFKRFYLRPSVIVPVYQNLKGDRLFYEDKNLNIRKWFHGIGIVLNVGKQL